MPFDELLNPQRCRGLVGQSRARSWWACASRAVGELPPAHSGDSLASEGPPPLRLAGPTLRRL